MKKLYLLLMVLILSFVLSACSSTSTAADYDSPKAVIEAHEAINTEWKNNSIYDDLKGKTFKVKTTQKLDKDNPLGDVEKAATYDKEDRNWLCMPYSSLDTDVMLFLTNEEWEKIKYNKGDTLILKVESIMQRGTQNGGLRQYYIDAILAD
ncbi:MAG: hypothetical protein IJS61_06670 [Firmicutes bacterium]|nr:hypothetical protein [Bacillota bacterium]